MRHYDVLIVGGGAAGFFSAINIGEMNPKLSVAILEKNKEGLQKVKVSGGGRCNVTHAEFIPSQLVTNYPRGEKELLGPFHAFMTDDTIEWFEKRGIALKMEEDGRMFPISDSSQTIINCFLGEAKRLGIHLQYGQNVKTISFTSKGFLVTTQDQELSCKKILITTGSSIKFWELLKHLGHTIVNPVPSLFTFNIKDHRIKDIPGVVAPNVRVKVLNSGLTSEGPLLVTHWGLSAPAILKLSAFGALELAKMKYKFKIEINFVQQDFEDCMENLKEFKKEFGKKSIFTISQFNLPKRLWQQLVIASKIPNQLRWADVNKEQLEALAGQLTQAVFEVDGKSTFKEEFVTAGGVDLKEINFKTFESRLIENLYFAGEVLNIDAITGGFNFQNAWTGAFLAAKAISS